MNRTDEITIIPDPEVSGIVRERYYSGPIAFGTQYRSAELFQRFAAIWFHIWGANMQESPIWGPEFIRECYAKARRMNEYETGIRQIEEFED